MTNYAEHCKLPERLLRWNVTRFCFQIKALELLRALCYEFLCFDNISELKDARDTLTRIYS